VLGTFVDTNVIVDLLELDADWFEWSAARVAEQADKGPLIVNVVILAELAAKFSTWDAMNQAVHPRDYVREDIPHEAAFVAGAAHREYRARGGTRSSTLPDFFIGAHAAVRGYSLLTRDAQRYRSYYPRLKLIAP
jgi:predicted nucleic acid-binding protein